MEKKKEKKDWVKPELRHLDYSATQGAPGLTSDGGTTGTPAATT